MVRLPGKAGAGLYDGPASSAATAEAYRQSVFRKRLFIAASAAVLLVLVVTASGAGAIKIPFSAVLKALFTFDRTGAGRIIWGVRLPRITAAVLVGAGLSVSGTVMQSVLRNPLASPYTLGLSGAAAFGASFAIVFLGAGTANSSSFVISNPWTMAACAFAFSMGATFVILLLARLTSGSADGMVLAGIAIGAMFSAGLTLMQYLADSVQLANIVSWTFGDLGRGGWSISAILAAAFAAVSAGFIKYRWRFNAMDAGEETAAGLGVNTRRLRVCGMLAASFLSAVIVSFFGIIAFIGLLGPHISRRCVGSDHRYLIPASMLAGASVLLAADTAARTVLDPMILPVGILTSLLGCPLFIYLLVKKRKG